MKKIVLASAVAAVMASGAAAAETTLGGQIRLQIVNQAELSMKSGKLVVNVNTSEDLGNGMTAFAKLEMENDNADHETSGWSNDKSYVGLKGGFGTVQLGVQSDAAGFACGGTDIFTNNSGSACGTGANNGSLDNALVYVNTFGATTLVLGQTFDGDAGVDSDSTQPAAGNHTVVALNFGGDGFSVGGQLTAPDSDLNLEDRIAIGGTVALGEATLGLTLSSNGEDANDTAYAVAVALPVAGGTLKAGIDMAGDDAIASFAGTASANETVTNIEYKKSLGKKAYAGVQVTSFGEADGATAADDMFAVYLGTSF